MCEAPPNGYSMIHACVGYSRDVTPAIIAAQDRIAMHLCMQYVKPGGNMRERERERRGQKGER